MKSRLILVLASLVACAVAARPASAAAVDYLLEIDGIKGETSKSGFVDSIQMRSFTVSNGSLSETQGSDSTAPALNNDLVSATLIPHAAIGLYDDPNTATHPDAQLSFHNVLISSIQLVTMGSLLSETVGLQFASPAHSLYLVLPGIPGESSPPGAPNAIAIDSLTVSGNSFSVHKAVDSTSPALQSALLGAHDFVTASLLLYSSISTETKPDFSIVFSHALISSIAGNGASGQPTQTVSFDATGSAVPEPGPLALIALVVACLLRSRSLSAGA